MRGGNPAVEMPLTTTTLKPSSNLILNKDMRTAYTDIGEMPLTTASTTTRPPPQDPILNGGSRTTFPNFDFASLLPSPLKNFS